LPSGSSVFAESCPTIVRGGSSETRYFVPEHPWLLIIELHGRGRSKAEFISKLSIVLEEADETLFWLELISEMKINDGQEMQSFMKEGNELAAIMASSIKTAKTNK